MTKKQQLIHLLQNYKGFKIVYPDIYQALEMPRSNFVTFMALASTQAVLSKLGWQKKKSNPCWIERVVR